jgi:hypothetical protein
MREFESIQGRAVPVEAASTLIDNKLRELGDWRAVTLARVRRLIHEADPEIVEEWKWAKQTSPRTPVFSHAGIVCTGETYKNAVKLTFAKGAQLRDPSHLFNASLEGNVRRAIASSSLSFPRACNSSAKTCKISSSLPSHTHCRKRRWQVWH